MICISCGMSLNNTAKFCGACGTLTSNADPNPAGMAANSVHAYDNSPTFSNSQTLPHVDTLPAIGGEVSKVMRRYADAYKVGQTVVTIGTTIKVVGGILAAIIAIAFIGGGAMMLQGAGMRRGSEETSLILFVLGGVYAGLVFLFFYVWGVIVSALGQILKANLDSAVHTSPFVNNEQRARIMSLV